MSHDVQETLMFGKMSLNDKISACPYAIPVNIRPLLDYLGQDATWRTVIIQDHNKLSSLPGYSSKIVHKLMLFALKHVDYTFMDLI